jgi:hypothetical protein
MNTHLIIIGLIFILLASMHVVFPKRFSWKTELESLTLINKQLMQVHTIFIAITVLLMGILLITSHTELLTTTLGKKLCFGLAVFWSIRLLFQFFVYSPLLWKGKKFETTIHIIFSLLWLYISIIFWLIVIKH